MLTSLRMLLFFKLFLPVNLKKVDAFIQKQDFKTSLCQIQPQLLHNQ